MKNDYLERILTSRVYDVAIESPLERANNLSARMNNTLLLKREDMQPVFSFKLRGAYNKMAQLSREQLGFWAIQHHYYIELIPQQFAHLYCKLERIQKCVDRCGQIAIGSVVAADESTDERHELAEIEPEELALDGVIQARDL